MPQSARRTHRDSWAEFRGCRLQLLRFIANCGLASPGSPSIMQHPWRGPQLAFQGPLPMDRAIWAASQSAGRAFLLMLSAEPLASAEGTCAEEYASEKSQKPIASSF